MSSTFSDPATTLEPEYSRSSLASRQAPDTRTQIPRRAAVFFALILIGAGLAASYHLLAPSTPVPHGSYACLPVNPQTLGPDDFPQGLATRFPDLGPDPLPRHALVFPLSDGALVSGEALLEGPESGHYGFSEFAPPSRRRGLVNFTHGLVSIETVDGAMPLALLRHSPIPNMSQAPDLFQSDMFTPDDYSEGDIPPLLYGEETDDNGWP